MVLHNIELSEEKIRYLINNKHDYGAESIIYKTNRNTVYKIFRDIPREVLENKYQKVKLLFEKNIDFMVEISSTISCNGQFVGYEMPLIQDCFWQVNLSDAKKIQYLKKLKQHLLELEDRDIIYADIKDDNLFIQDNRLILGDIDNVSIGNYRMDLIPCVLDEIYHDGVFRMDCHFLMHNCFTINILDDKFVSDFSNLSEYTFDRYNEKGKEIIKKMSLIKQVPMLCSKDYLIDNLK